MMWRTGLRERTGLMWRTGLKERTGLMWRTGLNLPFGHPQSPDGLERAGAGVDVPAGGRLRWGRRCRRVVPPTAHPSGRGGP
ncbi:hypothetical protein E6P78_24835 [Streptomyces sp. A0958]|nr:hypothetical protein E6P78_24835 [Streptomyces sp. A0958]